MSTISRTYNLVGATRMAESMFDSTPLADGEDAKPDRRVLEFHPVPGSPETFVGSGTQKFVVAADDPILGYLSIDSEWTLTVERTPVVAAAPIVTQEPATAIPAASPEATSTTAL